MGIDLYYLPFSPPCIAVMLTAKAVGVNLNLKMCDLRKGEQLTPEFLKMNPQHTVPTMNDDGFILCESRAICGYLVNKYGKDDTLYPNDPKSRALIDQRLYFDAGTLYGRFADYLFPMVFNKAPSDEAKKEKLIDALKLLDTFLEGQVWAAGKNMTIADLCLLTSISTIEVSGFDMSTYSNISRWYAKMKSTGLPCNEIDEGLKDFKAWVDKKINNDV